MSERIFVTGGTGFFGKSLLAAWRERPRPECSLTILSRDPERFRREHPEFAALPQVEWVKGDIRDFPFPAGRFDRIIHAATPASAALERDDPAEMYSIIVDGTRRVLEFARRCGAEKLLLTSSGAVYGVQPPELERIAETFPTAPVTAYGRGKAEAERLCLESGIPVVIARCFAFVGPYLPLDAHFAAGNFIRDALAGRPIVIRGDGRPYRSYLYASDLVKWLWTLLDRGEAGRVYHVGSGRAVSIAELARIAAGLVEPALPVEVLSPAGEGLPPRYVPDISRARRELELRVETDLEEALRLTFEFHRKGGIL